MGWSDAGENDDVVAEEGVQEGKGWDSPSAPMDCGMLNLDQSALVEPGKEGNVTGVAEERLQDDKVCDSASAPMECGGFNPDESAPGDTAIPAESTVTEGLETKDLNTLLEEALNHCTQVVSRSAEVVVEVVRLQSAETGLGSICLSAPAEIGWGSDDPPSDPSVHGEAGTGWGTSEAPAPTQTGWGSSEAPARTQTGWGSSEAPASTQTGWGSSEAPAPTQTGWGTRSTEVPVTSENGWGNDNNNDAQPSQNCGSGAWGEKTDADEPVGTYGWGSQANDANETGVWGADQNGTDDAGAGGEGSGFPAAEPEPPKPLIYFCGSCGAETNFIDIDELIDCKKCSYHVLYKKRQGRSVQMEAR